MGLIVISAVQSDSRPVNLLASMRPCDRLLEAPNPTVALRRDTHLHLEALDEPLRAHANRLRHGSDVRGQRHPVESREREANRCTMMVNRCSFAESRSSQASRGLRALPQRAKTTMAARGSLSSLGCLHAVPTQATPIDYTNMVSEHHVLGFDRVAHHPKRGRDWRLRASCRHDERQLARGWPLARA